MHSRATAAVVFAAVSLAFMRPAQADNAPSRPASEVNRHIAAMLATAPWGRPGQGSQVPAASATVSTPGIALAPSSPSRLLTPALLDLVARYSKAERLLHFQEGGLDANLWSVIGKRPSVHVRYVIHF